MNVLEFNPGWKTDIAFCFVDNTRTYQSNIREFMKNQADGTLANIYNKGWTVYQWIDEDKLLRHASNKGHQWAVVFSTGTEFINGTAFFDAVLKLTKQDFFIAGHILDRKDAYYELHHQCYVVNLEKYKQFDCPKIGYQELGSRHTQCTPWRSTQNYHDDYTPIVVSGGGDDTKEYNHKCHGWNILKIAFDADEQVLVFDNLIRESKRHFYPESPKDFNKHLSWAYHRVNYCQTEFVHTSNTEIVHLPIKLYDQIVTPASGVWFGSYLSDNATVIIYDYNQASLNYWKEHVPAIQNVNYQFVLCDLLGEDSLAHYILPAPNTLVNLSNIFNYEGTNFFYSLDYRKHKETELLKTIENVCPNAEVYFSLEAGLFDIVPTWHL
jgi:hypothetical protein